MALLVVEGGAWNGYLIRTARKEGQCNYSRGEGIGRCPNILKPGDQYVEGDVIDLPFTRARYCMQCAGPEARATWVQLHKSAPKLGGSSL